MLPPPPPSQSQPTQSGSQTFSQSSGGAGGSQAPRATDTNELADVLASSGIDLREEEAHLTLPSHLQYPAHNLAATTAAHLTARRQAELKANHANNPFLNARAMQNKIRLKARENNMTLGASLQQQQQQQQVGAQAPVGMVAQDITTFLSLGTRERLAGLLTRSVVLARQRRVGNGSISGEWGSFVKGGEKHQSIVNEDGSSGHNSLKRSSPP